MSRHGAKDGEDQQESEIEWVTTKIPSEAHQELTEVLAQLAARGTGVLPPPLGEFAQKEVERTASKKLYRGLVVWIALRYLRISLGSK